MQTVSLTWQHSGEAAAAAAVVGFGLRYAPWRRVRAVGPFLIEAAIIGVLYGLWQLAGRLSAGGTNGALGRSHWIVRAEHDIGLPSERSVQHLILGHPLIVQGANLYYATMHFTMMFVFLIWLFWRHRDRYRPVRTTMALATLVCLLVQLVPVAPPRMLPGFVDTAVRYGQSVYGGGFEADQLSAMPSVHVAWAVLIGWYAVRVSDSRWRWIAPVHTVLTVFVVVATGNHWWFDGMAAAAIVCACAWGRYGVALAVHRALARVRPERPVTVAEPEPVTL